MPITFQPLSNDRPIQIYRRALPHWRQHGATYFVTFREHDSLPAPLQQQLRRLRDILLASTDDACRFLQADRIYFLRLKRYLNEAHGACCLREPGACMAVHDVLMHFSNKRYELGEFKVLPNHVHVLVRPLLTFDLETILHTWKSYSAKAINKLRGVTGPVWQRESYDRLVRDVVELERTEKYIRDN